MEETAINLQSVQQFIGKFVTQKCPDYLPEEDGDTSFSALGLDSFDHVSIGAEIESRFQVAIEPTLVYDYPTLNSLAERVIELLNEQEVLA